MTANSLVAVIARDITSFTIGGTVVACIAFACEANDPDTGARLIRVVGQGGEEVDQPALRRRV